MSASYAEPPGKTPPEGEQSTTNSRPPSIQPNPVAEIPRTEPAPSYESLFGKVERARTQNNNTAKFSVEVFKIFWQTNGCEVAIGILMLIAVSMIAMGAIFRYDCPGNSFIPIFLIVFGVTFIVNVLLSIISNAQGNPQAQQKSPLTGILQIMRLFLFGFFIAGTVNVYALGENWVSGPPTAENYCHSTLFYYAFWVVTAIFIVIGTFLFIGAMVIYISSKLSSSSRRSGRRTNP